MYLSDVFTVPASLAGLPAVSVPSGLSPEGLPLGLQVLAPRFEEARMFAVARAFEREIGFSTEVPAGIRSLET
jgi:aspartyl-tRNA(Asn)/glutamyl-tRNA(Gln) amidotransferase subunit A